MAVKRGAKKVAEPKAEAKVQRSLGDLPHVRHEQYVALYANFAQCALTPWDMTITFSEIGESEIDKPAIIDRVAVTLTPALAKALIGVITANMRNYEAQFGEVPMPKGLIAPKLAEPKMELEEKK